MSVLVLQSSCWGRELVALLNLSSWCLMMVELLFLAVPWGCLRFVIVVFPDHTHLLFLRIFRMFLPFPGHWNFLCPLLIMSSKWVTNTQYVSGFSTMVRDLLRSGIQRVSSKLAGLTIFIIMTPARFFSSLKA